MNAKTKQHLALILFLLSGSLMASSAMAQRSDFGDRSRGSSRSDGREVRQAASRVLAVADEHTNSVVVSAPEELMATIEELIEEIDTVAESVIEVRVFPLKYADAEEMAEIVTDIFEEGSQSSSSQGSSRFGGSSFFFRRFGGGDSSRGSSSNDGSSEEMPLVAVADIRTNSVIVSAAGQIMDQIAQVIKDLDSNPAKEKKVFIYPLKNADPERVSEILGSMFGGNAGTSSPSSRQSSSQSGSSTSTFGSRTSGSSRTGSSGGGFSGR